MLKKRFEHTGGFALIEVLVAVVLLGIGLLGAAGMLSRAVGFTVDTERRQMAAMLAGELMETLRAARLVQADGSLPPDLGGYAKSAGASLNGAETCQSDSTQAGPRLACWSQRVRQLMPETGPGPGFIDAHFAIAEDAPGVVAITVAWPVRAGQCLDSGDAQGAAQHCTYTLRSRL